MRARSRDRTEGYTGRGGFYGGGGGGAVGVRGNVSLAEKFNRGGSPPPTRGGGGAGFGDSSWGGGGGGSWGGPPNPMVGRIGKGSTKVEDKLAKTTPQFYWQGDAKVTRKRDVEPVIEDDGTKVWEIDCSYLESSGQSLRNAIACGGLMRRNVRINKIRHNRPTPGICPTHLEEMSLAKLLCGLKFEGAMVESIEMAFSPGNMWNTKLQPSVLQGNCGTASPCTLMLQAALFPALLCKLEKLTMFGGTDVDYSPPADFVADVFCPILKKLFNLTVTVDVRKRGYQVNGGGELVINLHSAKNQGKFPLQSFTWDKHDGRKIKTLTVRPYGPPYLCNEMHTWYNEELKIQYEGAEIVWSRPDCSDESALGMGLMLETEDGCMFHGSHVHSLVSKKGKGKFAPQPKEGDSPAEKVFVKALTRLNEAWKHDGVVDNWMQDQLILPMALAKGTSRLVTGPMTDHTNAAIYVIEKLTGATFRIEEKNSSGGSPPKCYIECDGIGFKTIEYDLTPHNLWRDARAQDLEVKLKEFMEESGCECDKFMHQTRADIPVRLRLRGGEKAVAVMEARLDATLELWD